MDKTQEALKMAIRFAEANISTVIADLDGSNGLAGSHVLYACQEALAQPAQEPYGWEYAGAIWNDKDEVFGWHEKHKLEQNPPLPLYTHPAPSCNCKDKK